MATATVALAAFAAWQLYLMRESNEISQQSAKIQLRAYVSATFAEVVGIKDPGTPRVHITFRNSGQTPAYETSIHAEAWWEPIEKPKPGDVAATAAAPIEVPADTPTILASGEPVVIKETVEGASRRLIANRKGLIHATGTVTYTDIYGDPQSECFTCVQTSPTSASMRMTKCGGSPMSVAK